MKLHWNIGKHALHYFGIGTLESMLCTTLALEQLESMLCTTLALEHLESMPCTTLGWEEWMGEECFRWMCRMLVTYQHFKITMFDNNLKSLSISHLRIEFVFACCQVRCRRRSHLVEEWSHMGVLLLALVILLFIQGCYSSLLAITFFLTLFILLFFRYYFSLFIAITLLPLLLFSLYCHYSSLYYYYSFLIALILLFFLLLLFSHGVALFLLIK